jgi:hypothetical protein
MIGGAVLFTATFRGGALEAIAAHGRKCDRQQQHRGQHCSDHATPWHLLTILRLPIHWMPPGRVANNEVVEFVQGAGVS